MFSTPRISPAAVDDMADIIQSGEGRRKGKYGRFILKAILANMRNDTADYFATAAVSVSEIAAYFPGKTKRDTVSRALNDALNTGGLIRLKVGSRGHSSVYTFGVYKWLHDVEEEAERLSESADYVPRSECGEGDRVKNVNNSDYVPRSECGKGCVNNSDYVPRSGRLCPPFGSIMSPVRGHYVPRSECKTGGTSLTIINNQQQQGVGVYVENGERESPGSQDAPRTRSGQAAAPSMPTYAEFQRYCIERAYTFDMQAEYDKLAARGFADLKGERIRSWRRYADAIAAKTAPEIAAPKTRITAKCPECGRNVTAELQQDGAYRGVCTYHDPVHRFTIQGKESEQ